MINDQYEIIIWTCGRRKPSSERYGEETEEVKLKVLILKDNINETNNVDEVLKWRQWSENEVTMRILMTLTQWEMEEEANYTQLYTIILQCVMDGILNEEIESQWFWLNTMSEIILLMENWWNWNHYSNVRVTMTKKGKANYDIINDNNSQFYYEMPDNINNGINSQYEDGRNILKWMTENQWTKCNIVKWPMKERVEVTLFSLLLPYITVQRYCYCYWLLKVITIAIVDDWWCSYYWHCCYCDYWRWLLSPIVIGRWLLLYVLQLTSMIIEARTYWTILLLNDYCIEIQRSRLKKYNTLLKWLLKPLLKANYWQYWLKWTKRTRCIIGEGLLYYY